MAPSNTFSLALTLLALSPFTKAQATITGDGNAQIFDSKCLSDGWFNNPPAQRHESCLGDGGFLVCRRDSVVDVQLKLNEPDQIIPSQQLLRLPQRGYQLVRLMTNDEGWVIGNYAASYIRGETAITFTGQHDSRSFSSWLG
ncbi:hypothetical protein FIBSPDRAFT_883911 [Athelia psychrophila]|uniref:SH3 domain-containing protein n=1 Tax=Athelia psychrophila TaxID=1759441 RepID=A0A166TMR5_9AGAM|nr:hypothetical protein FIBSPDRAFT_883911 [Fibularhizoctonia sp. CBS 109695]